MIENKTALSAAVGLVAGAIGGVGGVAVASWLTGAPKFLGGPWWDVATAFGTLGTVAAAVYFATRDARAKRNEERLIARLTAIGLRARISKISFEMRPLISDLNSKPEAFADVKVRAMWKAELEAMIHMVAMEEVISISKADKEIGHCLMKASDRVRIVSTAFGYRPEEDEHKTVAQVKKYIVEAQRLMLESRRRIDALTGDRHKSLIGRRHDRPASASAPRPPRW
ncbi:hypothetical protein [Alcaligenes faecalis]|uniref:hypothetical protein n=1 Tax=Alcaligenes faecalis TaxID=511 RepID=UPI001C9B9C9C|nr:hypothetical protein [Alcaligenes faecalis]MBY6308675.1 hypothetical protein [Alcaligenes faecalis]MBY6316486.1 hypothetical protein [Alcaligenes faecalis]MBY6390307.1 hypothetical protein [Alcaligenes faecalis]